MGKFFDKRLRENIKITFERERLLSVTSLVVMFIAFIVLGFFVGLIVLTQTSIRTLEEQAQVTVFFKDDFPEEEILKLQEQYSQDDRVLSIEYVSKEDAYRIFSEINKNEPTLLESVSSSILPASLEVKAVRVGDLSELRAEIERIDGVEEIRFFEEVIEKFRFWSSVAYGIGLAVVVALLLISYTVVLMTLRTLIDLKGTEIEIVKLVGASDDYVKNPLLGQGMVYGFISSFLAALIIIPIFYLIAVNVLLFNDVLLIGLVPVKIPTAIFSFILFLILLLSGIGLGYFGSKAAVKKYLNY